MLEYTLYRISVTSSRIKNQVPQLTKEFIVQSPASRNQLPESSIQGPASRVERPTLASRVQKFWYAGLTQVKREYSSTQILKFSLPKYFQGSFVNRTQNSSKKSKPFRRLCLGRGSVVRPPTKRERLRDIQHSKSMVLDTRFHI